MSLRRSRPPMRSPRIAALSALTLAGALAGVSAPALAAPAPASHGTGTHDTRFYVPPPDPGAVKQIKALVRSGDLKDAVGVTRMVTTPQAVWFNGGTPAEVRRAVHKTVRDAARQHDRPRPRRLQPAVPGLLPVLRGRCREHRRLPARRGSARSPQGSASSRPT